MIYNLTSFRDRTKCILTYLKRFFGSAEGKPNSRQNAGRTVHPLVGYQRNIHEIVHMESNTLTKAIMNSSKSGFLNKRVWRAYIERVTSLIDVLSAKNLSVIMLSSAKARIRDGEYYARLSDRIMSKCDLYVDGTDFTMFNIFSITTACSLLNYKNEALFRKLWNVLEVKLKHINEGTYKNRYTLDDIAGILHSYLVSGVIIPEMVDEFGNLFIKLYGNKSVDGSKPFIIAAHSLVKLGFQSEDLYEIIMNHLLEGNAKDASTKDITMLYYSVCKLKNASREDERLLKLTGKLLDFYAINSSHDIQSLISLTSSVINLQNLSGIEEYSTLYNEVITRAIEYLVNNEVNNDIILSLKLLKNCISLSLYESCLLILSCYNFNQIGLRTSIKHVTQYITCLSELNKVNSNFIEPMCSVAITQLTKRLLFTMSPEKLKLAKTPAKPVSLYNILLQLRKGRNDDNIEINKDWLGIDYNTENVSHMGIILHNTTKFNFNEAICEFLHVTGKFLNKYLKYYRDGELNQYTIAAILHTYSKFRVRDNELVRGLCDLLLKDLDKFEMICLVSIMSSLGKLGYPTNHLFNVKGWSVVKIRRLNSLKSNIYNKLFREGSLLLEKNVKYLNMQMIVNYLFTLSLVGFDKVTRRTIARFLKRLLDIKADGGNTLIYRDNSRNLPVTFQSCTELCNQIGVVLLMLQLYKNRIVNNTRGFEYYIKKLAKLYNHLSKTKLNVQHEQSGIHKSVVRALESFGKDMYVEVPWKNGIYYMDVLVRDGRSLMCVEVDGPYHYYSRTKQMITLSRMKHFLITKHRKRVVHIPYYQWIELVSFIYFPILYRRTNRRKWNTSRVYSSTNTV